MEPGFQQTLQNCVSFGYKQKVNEKIIRDLTPIMATGGKGPFQNMSLCALSFLSESLHMKVISENKRRQNTVSLIIMSQSKVPLIQTLE